MSSQSLTARQKQTITKRANGRCEYCWSPALFTIQSFAIEHILPRSKGGKTVMSNLAFACQGCNNHKYNKTHWPDLISEKIVPLYHPRRQQGQQHFLWSEDFSLIIGIAATGRATVEALQMNREGLVNFRRLLHEMGEHPHQSVRLKTKKTEVKSHAEKARNHIMTTTLAIELQSDLLNFLDHFAKQRNCRRDEVIAEGPCKCFAKNGKWNRVTWLTNKRTQNSRKLR